MTMKVWLLLVSYVIGALALAALIWFVGPLVAIANLRPLDPAWSRGLAIGLIVAILAAAIVVTVVRRRRAEALLARGLEGEGAEDAEASGDGEVLAERMKDALQTLRKASGAKGDYLYDLPWYMIIGPPGSGKTTALINAGLKFPLARGRTPAAIAGVGGTRYCDWWFTEEAVLIDTAGRYTTQDSDAKGDQKSWLAFLDWPRAPTSSPSCRAGSSRRWPGRSGLRPSRRRSIPGLTKNICSTRPERRPTRARSGCGAMCWPSAASSTGVSCARPDKAAGRGIS